MIKVEYFYFPLKPQDLPILKLELEALPPIGAIIKRGKDQLGVVEKIIFEYDGSRAHIVIKESGH